LSFAWSGLLNVFCESVVAADFIEKDAFHVELLDVKLEKRALGVCGRR
jgi:hypothetical protein